MEYILLISIIIMAWKISSLTNDLKKLKTQKEVEDRFVKANTDTLYKRTKRNNTLLSVTYDLPTKEYDKKWEKFLDYKERLNK